jgi:hypothetical protein
MIALYKSKTKICTQKLMESWFAMVLDRLSKDQAAPACGHILVSFLIKIDFSTRF